VARASRGRDTPPERADRIRLDKWLWHARFFRTRSLASGAVDDGRVRVNGVRVLRPGQAVGPGDALTVALDEDVRVVRIIACGTRRGPASEARELYRDLALDHSPALSSPLE